MPLNRRTFASTSFASLALATMLRENAYGESGVVKVLHHPPKAKRVIQLFMAGAASHIDLFDHKPMLEKFHGEKSDFGESVEAFQDGLGPWMKSPFQVFAAWRVGQDDQRSGQPRWASASTTSPLSTTWLARPEFTRKPPICRRPVSSNLGSPAWVHGSAMDSVRSTITCRPLWSCPIIAVLPAMDRRIGARPFCRPAVRGQQSFHSERIRSKTLMPMADYVTAAGDRDGLRLIEQFNQQYQQQRADDSRLQARIRSYEMAAAMQLSAPEALDLSGEPDYIMKMYGLDRAGTKYPDEINPAEEAEYFGRKCLIARRLIERGVRFVQIWSGNDNGFPRRNWDSHEDIVRDHGPLARGMAVGTAALLKDLKQRGLLKDTIVLWTTEFGRMPSTQGSKGRDHNPYVFTNWLCGGGIKPGVTYGPSDQWGYKPLDRNNPTQVYDIHATILQLLGIDHKRLTVRHNGIDRRLTDVHGRVINQIIA